MASLIDVAPDPVSVGAVLVVVIFVVAAIGVLAGTLVLFLWYRKRSRRHQELIRPKRPPV